jgi:subtilisin family serine protease
MKRLGLLLYIGSALAGLSLAQGRRPDSVAERLIVQHRSGADRAAVTRALAANGAKLDKEVAQLRLSVIRVPAPLLDQVQKALEQSGLFNFVERDDLAKGAIVPNDPNYPSQWHLPKVQAPSAWDLTTGSSTAPIAIIDSGIDSTHPDLTARILPGWSFLRGTSNTTDLLGHGTAVAGTAAAISDNSTGVSGLNWRNPILPLVVLDSNDYASYSKIASSITYAADQGARVISISIAGTTASSTLQSAVDYGWNKGSVVFAAAGNNATSAPMYPAACDKVVAVS